MRRHRSGKTFQEREVRHPPPEAFREFPQPVVHRHAPAPASQLPDPPPEALLRFLRPDDNLIDAGQASPDKMRKLPPRNPAIYPVPDQSDFARVVPDRPRAEPCMAFLFAGSRICSGVAARFAHSRPLRAGLCPSGDLFNHGLAAATLSFTNCSYTLTSCRGLEPYEFAPVLGVHQVVVRNIVARRPTPPTFCEMRGRRKSPCGITP